MRILCISTVAVAFIGVVSVTPCLAQAAPRQFEYFVQPATPQGTRPVVPVVPSASAGPQLRGISVVLLEGDLAAGGGTAGIPAAAAKALADMKDFLPYKGYRVLDTQWTLGTGKIAVRLRGTGHDYDLELTSAFADPSTRLRMQQLVEKGLANSSALAQTPSGVSITDFKLRETVQAGPSQGSATLQGQRPIAAQASRSSEGIAELNGRVVNRYFDAAAASQLPSLIETAFRMDVGETVVVGTSRLQGDKALIVLLTAVAK